MTWRSQLCGIDMLETLAESVDLESRADLLAMAGNFGEATRLMKAANAIRKEVFGPYDPNQLREMTADTIRANRGGE